MWAGVRGTGPPTGRVTWTMRTRIRTGLLAAAAVVTAVSAGAPAMASTDGAAAAPAKNGTGRSAGPALPGVYSAPGITDPKNTTTTNSVRITAAHTYVGDHIGRTGRCNYRICLYWDSNARGAGIAFNGTVFDLAGYTWPNNGTGYGQRVKNNAASVENQGNFPASVYYNENLSGPMDWLNPGTWGNLVQTWNDNASLEVTS
jgi:hypothetical protein